MSNPGRSSGPENIGSLRLFSIANDEYLLAMAKDSRLAGVDHLRDQKIISFSRQNLSFTWVIAARSPQYIFTKWCRLSWLPRIR